MSHVDRNALSCTNADGGLTPCQFDTRTQTMTLTSIVGPSGLAAGELLRFSISGVFNPISTDLRVPLTLRTTDRVGGVIDQSQLRLSAAQPNPITKVEFIGDNSTVQEVTRYTLQFSVGVPLYQGVCTVTLYLPYPDFKLQVGSITDVQGIGLFGPLRSFQYQINANDNSILIKDACALNYVLPNTPATIYILGLRNPEVGKLTEPIRIKIWNA